MSLYSWQIRRRNGLTRTVGIILTCSLFSAVVFLSWSFMQDGNSFHSFQSTVAHETSTPSCSAPPLLSCPPAPPPPPCPPPSPSPPPSPYDPTKLALIAETRPLKHLPAVLGHMISIIPPEWTFLFLGSNASVSYLSSIPSLKRHVKAGKLSIKYLPARFTITSRETVSQMFTNPYLYSHVVSPAEHLLVFQPDSIFCAASSRTLNEYLEWDWIGAPWSKTATWGGNGGLSLRKVSKIMKVLTKERRKIGDGQLEDLWLSSRINALPGSKMPNATTSKGFSVESVWDAAPLGYHVGWLGDHHGQIWDDPKQVDHVLSYCPEIKIILDMKLNGDKPKVGL